MRVLLFGLNTSFGGAERHMLDLAGGLADLGHPVTLCAPHASELLRHARARNDVSAAEVPRDVRAVRALIGLIRTRRPDVVHLHSPRASVLGRCAARALPRSSRTEIAVLSTAHGWVPGRLKLRRAIERVYDATARWEDGAIAVAPSVAAQLRAHRYPGTIWVVPNGLNPAWGGGWRAEPRTPGKTLRIGFFGRLAEEKGLPFLLDALRGLDGYDWHLDVIGDGHARDAVEHAIAQGGLQGRVTLHGAVSPADVPARMAGAHIVVLPSYEEGHPYVALEASRLGLPIVATSVGGIPEVVRDGENGLLVRPGDVPALTRAMRRLLEEDDLLDHLRRGAAATGDAYTSIHMTARIVAVYREILARRRRSDAAEGGGDSS